MQRFSEIVTKAIPNANANYPGAGAAGGLGFALRKFLHADLKPGIEIVIQHTVLAETICNADVVITGEGRLDAQTVMGKVPVGIAKEAQKHSIPVIAFCGCAGDGARECNEHGIDAYFPILRGITTADAAMNTETAARNLTDTAELVFRLYKQITPG